MGITATLVDFIQDSNSPSARAEHTLALSLMDWFAVTLAGQTEPVAGIVREHALHTAGRPEATAIGTTSKLPAASAALVNGTTSHALDYDDTHFAYIGHPSVAVMPAALAMAEVVGANRQATLNAALTGLEVATRVGVWLGRTHYGTGYHVTSTAGSVGATAAAAKLLGLNAEQTAHALSSVASRASGVRVQFGSMAKPWHAGLAASNGVEAAQLAACGFLAAANALDAPQGFAATHHSENNLQAFDGLGKTWLFEDVTHKFHACCHGTHAMLDALLILREKNAIDPGQVERIDVTVTPQFEHVCHQLSPQTGLEAKFSYRLLAAAALYKHDTSRLDTYTDALCTDADVAALRDKVHVQFDPDIAETAARVTLTHAHTTFSAESDLIDSVFLKDGQARERRVLAKAGGLIGEERTGALWQAITRGAQNNQPLATLLNQ